MSETTQSPISAPASTLPTRTITDTLSRRFSVREMDVVEQLDLYELAGANSTNPAWLGTAMMVASVRAINDVPLPFPSNPLNLRAGLRRIGREGMDALRTDRAAQQEAEDAAALAAVTPASDGTHRPSAEEN